MSAYKYDESVYHINSIQFSVYSNDAVKEYSSVSKDDYGINLPESYENSEPKRGGLVDTRLGITDLNLDCAYCGLKAKDCPGHFGHTELSEPVFHTLFFPIVRDSPAPVFTVFILPIKTKHTITTFGPPANDLTQDRFGSLQKYIPPPIIPFFPGNIIFDDNIFFAVDIFAA